jgi:Na+-transporting NADH:ubiquinone oxidoreductase subunit A
LNPPIKIKQGLNIPVSGRPQQSIHDGPPISQVALCGPDYIGLKPRILVEVGERVKLGQPLFIDKHHPGVPYCAPGTGEVVAINRGPRRVLHSVVISLEKQEAREARYDPMKKNRVHRLEHGEVRDRLCESGLWTAFRQRPFSHVPVASSEPRAIFVTAMDTRPLAADPRQVIREDVEAFSDGLGILPLLTPGTVYLCTGSGWDIELPETKRVQRFEFTGPHPSGLPGTHIHHLEPVGAGRMVWHIGYQDVIAIGKLFTRGEVDYSRVVALGGSCMSEPRLVRTRIGASVSELTRSSIEYSQGVRVISGSVLGGRTAAADLDFLGRYHEQVCTIPECGHKHLFGWTGVFPWRYSAARTFLRQAGHQRRFNITTAQNGRFSGMIPTRAFEKVMPLDILPSPLFRALLVKDTDQAQALGCLELDEEDLALCSFVCPAKIDYGAALRINLQQIEKEG